MCICFLFLTGDVEKVVGFNFVENLMNGEVEIVVAFACG